MVVCKNSKIDVQIKLKKWAVFFYKIGDNMEINRYLNNALLAIKVKMENDSLFAFTEFDYAGYKIKSNWKG